MPSLCRARCAPSILHSSRSRVAENSTSRGSRRCTAPRRSCRSRARSARRCCRAGSARARRAARCRARQRASVGAQQVLRHRSLATGSPGLCRSLAATLRTSGREVSRSRRCVGGRARSTSTGAAPVTVGSCASAAARSAAPMSADLDDPHAGGQPCRGSGGTSAWVKPSRAASASRRCTPRDPPHLARQTDLADRHQVVRQRRVAGRGRHGERDAPGPRPAR